MAEPVIVRIQGQSFALSDADIEALYEQVQPRVIEMRVARQKAEEDAARAAGQVWTAVYYRYFQQCEEECFSLKEAYDYLEGGSDRGDLSIVGVRLPDGTLLEGSKLDKAAATEGVTRPA